MDEQLNERLRSLPAVDRVVAQLTTARPRRLLVGAARRAIDRARARVRAGDATPSLEEILADATNLLDEHDQLALRRVINATGVLIHTNLGRVPLGDTQLAAVTTVAGAYSNLEYDLLAGERGSRQQHAGRLLRVLTGAESAVVVNNNAAAVLLTLASLASDREVIISRGELVEIGGEFRIPEVMAAARARLVEVGTTNRTHLGDYERAITPSTAAILKVHPSNYRIVGFTSEVAARDLARLARGRGVCFVHDLGSGLIRLPAGLEWEQDEPQVELALADGADVVTFSGDKLLGGPQAGVILGRRKLLDKMSTHPLLRALRPDKMTLAALEATLQLYLEDRMDAVPLWQMAATPVDELERRARGLVDALAEAVTARGIKVEAVPTTAVTGGGSLPTGELPSWGVTLVHPERGAAEVARVLLQGALPVVGRVDDDRVILDLRTVQPKDDPDLISLIRRALA